MAPTASAPNLTTPANYARYGAAYHISTPVSDRTSGRVSETELFQNGFAQALRFRG
jgi:hypothetical protein